MPELQYCLMILLTNKTQVNRLRGSFALYFFSKKDIVSAMRGWPETYLLEMVFLKK